MPLPPLTGHLDVRRRLSEAVRMDRLPQVILISGPRGVGKQRLALWLGQLLLCQRRATEPCGDCRPCRLVQGLAHPDVHWLVPVPRAKTADPDKAIEETALAIADVMDEYRKQPLYQPPDGMASHSIAAVRLLHQRASLTAVEGGRRIFVIGDAERLVPQESSPEAANALLKLLEEPPAGSLFVLTAADPRQLLPTIRSRAVPVRLQRLTDAEVRGFLRAQEAGLAPDAIEGRVSRAEGCIGAAVASADGSDEARRAAGQLLDAVLAGPIARYERALKQTPWSARGDFTALLDALAETFEDAARSALGHATRRPVPPALAARAEPGALLRALERVADAREAAAGNVNPQVLLAVLGEELAEVL